MIDLSDTTPGYHQNILISINALADIDIGLYRLIKEEYLDPSIFDKEFLTKANTLDFIMCTYFRKFDNPLYAISVIDDFDTLDNYYTEFMETQYKEIFDRAVYTDVLRLTNLLLNSKECSVSILYYSEYSKEKIISDNNFDEDSSRLSFLNIKDIKREIDKYDTIYLRSIFEFDNIKNEYFTSPKSFYISTFARNYDNNNNIIRIPSVEAIMTSKLMHTLSKFSMYDIAIINKNRKPLNKGVT